VISRKGVEPEDNGRGDLDRPPTWADAARIALVAGAAR
jgi:hypothetical protein